MLLRAGSLFPGASTGLSVRVIALAVALAMGLGGCGPGIPEAATSADDTKEAAPTERVLAGSLWSNRANQAISPDGKHLLTSQYYGRSERVLVVPLADGGEVTVLRDVADISVGEDIIQCWPLGWLSADRCLFAVCGPSIEGPHEGARGISILEARLADRAEVRELAFIPLGSGRISSGVLVQEGEEIVIHAWDSLWEFSLSERSTRMVKSGPEMLPSEGLTLPAASPDCGLWVYRGTDGLRMVDTATGESTLVFPTGDSFSFEPVWSPDGRFVAAYAAPRKDDIAGGRSELSWEDYEVFPSEPGFVPMAGAITIADREGRTVRTVSVENKMLADFRWSPDSSDLLFLTCTYHTEMSMSPMDHSKEALVPVIAHDGVWAAPAVGEKVVQLADLRDLQRSLTPNDSSDPTQSRLHVHPVRAIGSNKGLLLQVWAEGGGSVWYVSEDAPPTRVAEGELRTFEVCPDTGRPVPGLISAGSKTELWMLAAGESRRVTEFDSNFVNLVGYNGDLLVLFEGHAFEPAGILRVLSELGDNLFDAREAKAGDKVLGLTIASLSDITERPDSDYYSVSIKFSGEVTISGNFFCDTEEDVASLGGTPQVRFSVDGESASRLPKIQGDTRSVHLVFSNYDEAIKAFGLPGSIGRATIVIDDYLINRIASCAGVNQARLVKVVPK